MPQLKIKDNGTWVDIPAGGVGVPSGGTAGQVLTKSSSTDYATEWATPQHMVLLWENSNPSANFAAQTISLDLSGYSQIMISAYFTANWQYIASTIIVGVGVNGYLNSVSLAGVRYGRPFTTTTSTVSLQDCTSSGTNPDNSGMIPYRIYGIKV